MLKIMNLISLFTIAIGGLNICCIKNNIFMSHRQKEKLNDPFSKVDAAYMEPYDNRKKLNYRLNIYMTGDMYAYFLAAIKDQDIEDFVQLLVNKKPYLHDNWGIAQQEINEQTGEYSILNGKIRNYFKDILINAIAAYRSGSLFKSIFLGENMEYNTFKLPPHNYSVKELQRNWRREGVILQFNFLCQNPTASSGRFGIVNDFRIFPYTSDVISLLKYYQNVINYPSGQLDKITPPKLGLLGHPGLTKQTLSNPDLMKEFVTIFTSYFNCSELGSQKLISLPLSQKFITISDNISKPTCIIIDFNKDNLLKTAYISKPIDLYIN